MKAMSINSDCVMQRVIVLFSIAFFICTAGAIAQDNRSFDGVGNNLESPTKGSVGATLPRLVDVDYADGISTPKIGSEFNRPNPRLISNKLFSQNSLFNDALSLSDLTWVFGQFIDHDITLVENNPTEILTNIIVPEDDEFFPIGMSMPMARSLAAPGTGTDVSNPRQHANSITAFIDGSAIYGSDEERANWLRSFQNGKLKTSDGNLLPWNTVNGNFNDPIDSDAPFMADDTKSLTKFYIAGDIRANENPLLISMHTLFLREHNRLCDEILLANPDWTDEEIYQRARKMVGAYLQNIVFYEWLPAQGVELPTYTRYDAQLNPGIFNEFSAAAFRLGHTLINSTIIRMDNDGEEVRQGNVALKDAFFNPNLVPTVGGIDPYFKGMATQVQQDMDCKVVDDVRNFLFADGSPFGLDLAAININRGRERGLPDYNSIRRSLGIPALNSFEALTQDMDAALLLEETYGNVDNLDPWVGMLSEHHLQNALFGEVVMTIIKKQFQVLRDGDRFYFENDPSFSADEMEDILSTRMRDLIMRNTDINLMQDEVFKAMPHNNIPNGPSLIPVQLKAALYPNPAHSNTVVKVYMEEETEIHVKLLDYMGKELISNKVHTYEGDNFVELDLTNCPRGLYNVIVQLEDKFSVLKLVKE